MKVFKWFLPALVLGGAALAGHAAENDALAIESAKIGIAQAIAAAEAHVGGRASKAEYEKSGGKWVYDVEVVKGKAVMDVKVDAASGKVIAATADREDEEAKEDHED